MENLQFVRECVPVAMERLGAKGGDAMRCPECDSDELDWDEKLQKYYCPVCKEFVE